ncbi:MAG: hypothetical protein AAHH96_02550 [Candidatus Symbiodolus clandestinus]
MISNQKINTVKPKQHRILKTNRYLKRLLKKLRKRLARRWQEMPFIRHNVVKDNSNLKNRLHTSHKKTEHRRVSTAEEDKISRVKPFKVRSQCSALNINQDFIALRKSPPLKNFSFLMKPMRIFTLSRLICELPVLTKTFYYSAESIQKSRTRPIVTTNTGISAYIPEYKYEHTDFHNKRQSITLFNPDSTIHPYFYFVKKYPLFKIISFNKSIKPEDRGMNLYSLHKPSYNNLSKTYFDDIMQKIDNSTADLFKLKEDAKKLKKHLKKSESSQQETKCFIRQLQDLEKTAIQIESCRIQAIKAIKNIDLNSKDSKGKTLAHYLAKRGDFSLLQSLILCEGLNPFIKDNQGFLPKDIANNNRLNITKKHMKETQNFLSDLELENFKIYPKNPKSSTTLTIDTRNFFMPTSNSSKSSSSNCGLFSRSYINQDLIDIMNDNKNDFYNINHLCKKYIFEKPPVNFKDICNTAIKSDQPFYLLIILTNFENSAKNSNKEDYKETPLIAAIHSKKLYPFAMLLHLKFRELHPDYQIDDENIFDIANRLEESFYILLLGMKNKKSINSIDYQKHKKISHLKEKINLIIELSLLKDSYHSIESKIKKLKDKMDDEFFSCYPWYKLNSKNTKNTEMSKENYQNILELKSYVETSTNKIEEELKNLKKEFLEICELTVQDIKNIKTTNIPSEHPTNQNMINNHTTNNIYPAPPLSHAPQSSSQTGHPTSQNIINNHTTNNIYPAPPLSHAPQSSSQTGHPTGQNIINNHTTNNIYPVPPLSHAPQSSSQTGHPTGQNIINNHTTNNIYPNPLLSHAPQSSSQTGYPTGRNLTNALASYHPQSSHQASQSTTDQQYLSLSSNHSPAFRSEQSISQEPQNINSIPNLINLSTSF